MLCGSIDEYDRKGEKKRMILFFSGTGNSRHVAMNLASMIGEANAADMGNMIKRGERRTFKSDSPYILSENVSLRDAKKHILF